MIREDEHVLSRRPYAVDLTSLRSGPLPTAGLDSPTVYRVGLDAVWFRRKNGVVVATLGQLWDSQSPAPADAAAALRYHDDGRYGGDWIARWDGSRYIGARGYPPDTMAAHLAILRPALERYPAVPAGHDGWWRFETRAELRRRRAG